MSIDSGYAAHFSDQITYVMRLQMQGYSNIKIVETQYMYLYTYVHWVFIDMHSGCIPKIPLEKHWNTRVFFWVLRLYPCLINEFLDPFVDNVDTFPPITL